MDVCASYGNGAEHNENVDRAAVARAYKIIKAFGEIDVDTLSPELRSKYYEWLICDVRKREREIALEMVFEEAFELL